MLNWSIRIQGPEEPTLAERPVLWFGLPYLLGAAIVALAIFAIPPSMLTGLQQQVRAGNTPDAPAALAFAFQQLLTPSGNLLRYFLPVYLFYAPHFMRQNLIRAERSISPLLPKGEEQFHEEFGSVSRLGPQALIWGSLTMVLAASDADVFQGPRIANPVFSFTYTAFTCLALSSMIWAYLTTLRGIHKIGTSQLELRRYYKDRLLGLKPIGSLSLNLAAVYFGAIGLSMAISFIAGSILNPVVVVFFIGFIVFGLLMFFLPLQRIHWVMLNQKLREKQNLENEMEQVYGGMGRRDGTDLSQVFFRQSLLETTEKRIKGIATWPFDTETLGKLVVMVASLLVFLLRRLIGIPGLT